MPTVLLHKLQRSLRGEEAGVTDGQLLESFLGGRQEAFETLVQRHGAMVWGTCRRVLRNDADAEDAFQAAFLVLVRKAASIRPRNMVGNWLYGVAQITALKARAMNARRSKKEQEAATRQRTVAAEETGRQLHDVLDQELKTLPDKYRAVIVLCDLQGKSIKEAAGQMECPMGTVGTRLARGRSMLARRLARHGLAVTTGTMATLLAGLLEAAPPQLVHSTVQAATGQVGNGLISANVAALTQGVIRTMLRTKTKTVASKLVALALAVGISAWACLLALALLGPVAAQTEPPKKASDTPAQPAGGFERGRLVGRITAADTGKPLAGAKIRVLTQGVPGEPVFAEAVSGADGKYEVEVPLGHGYLFGLFAPTGYYTQDPKTYGAFLTSAATREVVRDYSLQPGAAWNVEMVGLPLPLDKPPLLSATPDPDRQMMSKGEGILLNGDVNGQGVISIPTTGGRYRFGCSLTSHPVHYGFPAANLEIDKDFDPRNIQWKPEPLADRKAVRVRDVVGRTAIVEGVEVAVEAGHLVLRFHANQVPPTSAIVLRALAVDDAGKPIAGAQFTASFASGSGAAMSQIIGMTDGQGRLELRDVRLPDSFYISERRVSLVAVKSGFHGVQTKELNIVEVKRAGAGDFGTVVLAPGRTLRGKVVNEEGQPVHGALLANHTNYFLYSNLRCRSDAEGRFAMPDLAYGKHKITAQYGERWGETEFQFDAQSGDCLVTVKLSPKSGTRSSVSAAPRAAAALKVDQPAGDWDLTPPTKEPRYQKEPKYALLVFGPKRETRIWLVFDGTTLYVDRNGNGDLTEADERIEPNNPADGSNKFGGSGSHTHFDVFDFTVQAGRDGASKFTLQHWIRAENFVPKTDFDKKIFAEREKLGYENSTLWRKTGLGQGQTPLLFMPKPADAQVCALDGPLTFVVKMADQQVIQRGEAGSDLAFHIVTMGRPHRDAKQQCYNPLATKEVPEVGCLAVEIEFPAKTAALSPIKRKFLLKQRC